MEQAAVSGTYVYDPSRPPAAVPGCPACLELAAQRAEARHRGDASAATDANVLFRRHLETAHVD
ncbi:hypothetical protein I3F58_00380 [Streptomyces sp. MUM 203J]|uniref:hypothetical protein n=1 Tax=Streptomyces sp. MUM 203J TaxID=2791990 RepID=UPI001F03CA54|nr:hypothetical protein [Streptomyces sp. MUM 203J]MCH0538041.1 hypothetical protein [Streptomyces sp. MUM 203J]